MKTITNKELFDILGLLVSLLLAVIICSIAYSKGVEEGQRRLLTNRQVECEVIDYTTKDGFFKAVREGVAIRLIEK